MHSKKGDFELFTADVQALNGPLIVLLRTSFTGDYDSKP